MSFIIGAVINTSVFAISPSSSESLLAGVPEREILRHVLVRSPNAVFPPRDHFGQARRRPGSL
jgi:hypothetical protein